MKPSFKIFSITLFALLFFNNTNAQTSVAGKDTLQINGTAFSKVEVEAAFPGGAAAWTKYITKQIMQNADGFRKKDFGTCIVKFIVDKKGNISEVEAITMKKTKLAKVVVEAIETGPKWIPAQQNGTPVNAYRLQPVTLTRPG